MLALREVLGLIDAEAVVRHSGSDALADIIGAARRRYSRPGQGRGYDATLIGAVGRAPGQDTSFTSIARPVEMREGSDTFLRFSGLTAGDQSAWFPLLDPAFAQDGIIRIVARDVGTAPGATASRGVGILQRLRCSDDLATFRAYGMGPSSISGSMARRLRIVDSAATLGAVISNVVSSSTASGVAFGAWYAIEMYTAGQKFGGRIVPATAPVLSLPAFGAGAGQAMQYDASALGWTDGQAGFDIRLTTNAMSVDVASISWTPFPPDMPAFT